MLLLSENLEVDEREKNFVRGPTSGNRKVYKAFVVGWAYCSVYVMHTCGRAETVKF